MHTVDMSNAQVEAQELTEEQALEAEMKATAVKEALFLVHSGQDANDALAGAIETMLEEYGLADE